MWAGANPSPLGPRVLLMGYGENSTRPPELDFNSFLQSAFSPLN